MKVEGGSNQVVQKLSRSLRSFRVTDTLRKANRYAVFADRKMQEVGFPRDINDLRSYVYTFSIINNDLRAFVPSNFIDKTNRLNLKFGKLLGDYNAVKNTITRQARRGGLAGIGQRTVRRVGGRISGTLLNTVIPSGDTVFTRAVFRTVRSSVGANLTIEMDRFLKGQRPETTSSKIAASFGTLAQAGQLNAENVASYIFLKIRENTPIDSGSLIETLKMRKGRSGGNVDKVKPDYHVSIGNVKPMPDPRVPYPWVVEFGINSGFNKGTQHLDYNFPIPKRFQFLRGVTGPRPPGDTFYGGRYDNDDRSPFKRAPRNYGKGAMVRRALQLVIDDGKRYKTFTVGLPKYRSNPFKELVWDKAQDTKSLKGRGSTRDWETPF